MSTITAEMLHEEIAKMERVVLAHNGAIEFAQFLLSQIVADDGIPADKFAEMVAGNGAMVESIEAVE